MYEDMEGLCAVSKAEAANTKNQYDEQVKKSTELKTKLQDEIRNLEIEKNNLAMDKQKFERLAQQYQSQADSWKGVMAGVE